MYTQFENRREAGKFLAEKLKHLAENPDVVVLALPRGGVPVAYESRRNCMRRSIFLAFESLAFQSTRNWRWERLPLEGFAS
jgi:hypothetical protein